MLKRTLCSAVFTWKLSCEGPLLIRDERYAQRKPHYLTAKDGYPQCIFMSRGSLAEIDQIIKSCAGNPPKAKFYVPGTSLRGPFRAQAERILRSLCGEDASPPKTACDPFQAQDEKAQYYCCSKRLEKKDEKLLPYARACPACRIFGCAGLSSRIAFTDADIAPSYSSAYRDMIGIDRFSGGVYFDKASGSGANMKLHVLENTSFTSTVTLTNFELWHLGLLSYVFKDFKDRRVPIGFGKSKGFGLVKGEVTKIDLSFCREPTGIEHLGSLMSEKEFSIYDVKPTGAPEFAGFDGLDQASSQPAWTRRRSVSGPEKCREFMAEAEGAFHDFIASLNPPGKGAA
jgi:CRISPR-associated RAMP protein (TIGR02581 family)